MTLFGKKVLLLVIFGGVTLCSCDTFLQGMTAGMGGYGGYGMGGYQVMPGGFVRNTSMDYLLDPRYAVQQVLLHAKSVTEKVRYKN